MKKLFILSLIFICVLFLIGCQGIDLEKVSDTDLERISEKAVVCNKPYIRLGTGCCLDQSNNNICDSDESKVTSNPQTELEEEEEQSNENMVIEEPVVKTYKIKSGVKIDPCLATVGITPETIIYRIYGKPVTKTEVEIKEYNDKMVKEFEEQGLTFYRDELKEFGTTIETMFKGIEIDEKVKKCFGDVYDSSESEEICETITDDSLGEVTQCYTSPSESRASGIPNYQCANNKKFIEVDNNISNIIEICQLEEETT